MEFEDIKSGYSGSAFRNSFSCSPLRKLMGPFLLLMDAKRIKGQASISKVLNSIHL